MTIKGAKAHSNRLKSMMSFRPQSQKALLEVGELIAEDAAASIRNGAVSGPGHVPSLPGEPPNADTHRLDMSIDAVVAPTGKTVRVRANAPYAAFLEFGTSKMVERPFLRPALRRNRNRLVQGQVTAVKKSVRVLKGS